MSENVIPFDLAKRISEDHAARRKLSFLSRGHATSELDPTLGTREEWLSSAIDHLINELRKQHRVDRTGGGYITVAASAVELVLTKLDVLDFDDPAGGDAA